jgi:hypothetical protein
MSKALIEQLTNAVRSRHPLIYIHGPEENRVLDALEVVAGNDRSIRSWTCVSGLEGAGESTIDPVAAIEAVSKASEPTFFVFKDLSAYLDRADVERSLRSYYYAERNSGEKVIVIVSPESTIPHGLDKEVYLITVPVATPDELLQAALDVSDTYPDANIPESLHGEISLALRGLMTNEVTHVMHRACGANLLSEDELLGEIFAEKEIILRRSPYLEYVPPHKDLAQMGGYENLREWIDKRRELFSQEAVDSGLPIPKGILIMGISGCGKSLAAKFVAQMWKIPLFRLDMNLIFSGLHGTPEATFHRALKAIESVAPVVLWIDEMENGLGMQADGNFDQSHIFSAFLTWMQEKPPLVFVAATANRIESLPAEIIRKGRFDQVFFCDLPSDDERSEIIRIHIERNGGNPDDFDINNLCVAMEGWNGAEVEQAVIAGRIDAAEQDRLMTTRDIHRHTRQIVPLADTMAEQIKAIRRI